ncbi:MAG TPA: serine hydrolase [Burkholderiales bacterium]|nr:serine hydrolase [Burkholderiales bacterium]
MKPLPLPQATLANWREAPYNRWAFHHVRELIPSADIAHDPQRVRELGVRPRELDIAQFLAETGTDAFVVLHRGALIAEHYAHGMSAASPHILMSVSKSMLGLLFGSLGIDAERQVTDFVPELANTAYKGATVRQLLDMRTGVAFAEDYLATSGPIVEYRKATGWNPLAPGERASDLHSFYQVLTQRDAPHGGRFHYISPNTDLLGWVIERATGSRYAELMSEHLWRPIGAEHSAYITVDRLGAPRTAGGMCVTARDLARAGQWMIEHESAWVRDIENRGDRAAWDAGSFVAYFPGMPMRYRSQWYILEGDSPLVFAVGIHGQHLFVDRKNQLVIAKLSSQALPLDAGRIALTMRAVSQIRKWLA